MMTIFVPLVAYKIADEEKDVCDYVLQGFINEADAKILYPNADIRIMEVADSKPEDN